MSWLSEHRLVIILVLMVLGALFSVGGAFWLAFDSSKKSEKIASLNEQIAGSVTGGDSFCYLFPIIDRLNKVEFSLHHEGKYPVFDVTIKMFDGTKLDNINNEKIMLKHLGYVSKMITDEEGKDYLAGKVNIGEELKWEKVHEEIKVLAKQAIIINQYYGTVAHDLSFETPFGPDIEIPKFILPADVDSQKFLVYIFARNGFFQQEIIFKRIKDRWLWKTQIRKRLSDGKEEIIYKLKALGMEDN